MQSEWIIRFMLFWGVFIFFLGIEKWNPFRKPVQSKLERVLINLKLGILNTVLLSSTTGLLLLHFNKITFQNKRGLLHQMDLSDTLNFIVLLVLFDFILYVWHRANHNIPILWRFHKVHHTDLDIDVSTASRFHIGELLIAFLLKLIMIYLVGPAPKALFLFDACFLFFTQFNHSNIKIHRPVERHIERVLITPFLHRSHHSTAPSETNSNYGTIFSFWDKIFRTYHLKEDQRNLTLGHAEYQDKKELTFRRLWALPLKSSGFRDPGLV